MPDSSRDVNLFTRKIVRYCQFVNQLDVGLGDLHQSEMLEVIQDSLNVNKISSKQICVDAPYLKQSNGFCC